jgi:signal transduction histidine kinase
MEPPSESAVALFRILQESVMNAVQHGRAEHVFATVELEAERIVLTVEDDGIGFDVAALAPRREARGLGVLGMEERARLVGGWCRISSTPGEGTLVEVTVPVAQPATSSADEAVGREARA